MDNSSHVLSLFSHWSLAVLTLFSHTVITFMSSQLQAMVMGDAKADMSSAVEATKGSFVHNHFYTHLDHNNTCFMYIYIYIYRYNG